MAPDIPGGIIDHGEITEGESTSEHGGEHNIPIPEKYSDFVEAYRYLAYLVDYGIVTVANDISNVNQEDNRIVIIPGDGDKAGKLYVHGEQIELGGGVDHIEGLDLDGDGVINVEDKDGNPLTLQGGNVKDANVNGGTVDPDTLLLPELGN